MAHPAKNACPEKILSSAPVFFATTKTSMARRLLQSERNAMQMHMIWHDHEVVQLKLPCRYIRSKHVDEL
jgi:hypothetical protein